MKHALLALVLVSLIAVPAHADFFGDVFSFFGFGPISPDLGGQGFSPIDPGLGGQGFTPIDPGLGGQGFTPIDPGLGGQGFTPLGGQPPNPVVTTAPFDPLNNPNQLPFNPNNFNPAPGSPIPSNPTSPLPVNQPPILNAIGNKVVNEGQLLTFIVSGSDPEGQSISFSAANLPSGAVFGSQAFTWTPNLNQQGLYSVTFTVTDNTGQQDSETIQITVVDSPPAPVNHAPVFLSTPLTNAFVREAYVARVVALDPDGTAPTLQLSSAPNGMRLQSVKMGYTVFASSIAQGMTASGTDSATGASFTVTNNAMTQNSCDLTINNQRRTVPYPAGQTQQTTTNGVTYTFTVQPDVNFGQCFVTIVDPRTTVGWLTWTPEPDQQGFSSVTLVASDGSLATTQAFSINVTIDPRLLGTTPQPTHQPREEITVNTIAMPDDINAGETLVLTLNFKNSGDLKLDNADATVSIPELGVRSPTIGPLDLRRGKDVSRTLSIDIPEDAAPGLYTVRVTIDSGSVHRVLHRDIDVRSDY